MVAVPYDAHATRARLIDAAVAEFALRGLSGARVDRIAQIALANKRAIYDYFGNKEGLFDVAVSRVIDDLTEAVPLRQGDLAAYALDLFDYLMAHPETVRMIAWRRLERPERLPRLAETFLAHLGEVRDHDPAGATGAGAHEIEPADLVILMVGLANAWDLSGAELMAALGHRPDDPARIAAHRAAVVEAAHRIAPAGS